MPGRQPMLGRNRLAIVAASAMLLVGMRAVAYPLPAAAAGIVVTTTADSLDAGGGACGSIGVASLPGTDGFTSLREAICAANNTAGADTITFGVNGTFTFTRTGEDDLNSVGDLDLLESVTIVGNGIANTVLDGGLSDRLIDTYGGAATKTIVLSGLTLKNGSSVGKPYQSGGALYVDSGVTATLSDVVLQNNTAELHGGAIDNRGSLTLTTTTFTNNSAAAFGGALYSLGALAISASTFSGNVAEYGGGLWVGTDQATTVTITTSTFSTNAAQDQPGGPVGDFGDGGAIYAKTDGTVAVTRSTFTGNTAARAGGAFAIEDDLSAGTGSLQLNTSRIVGNTAVTAATSGGQIISGTASTANSWWGCNAGPTSAPCDRLPGGATVTSYLVLRHAASPTTIAPNGSSTLTADFLTNSASQAVAAADLVSLVGVTIGFGNPVLGTLSNAATTIASTGSAQATYTAGASSGNGSADATVDGQTVSAAISIVAPATATPTSTATSTAIPTAPPATATSTALPAATATPTTAPAATATSTALPAATATPTTPPAATATSTALPAATATPTAPPAATATSTPLAAATATATAPAGGPGPVPPTGPSQLVTYFAEGYTGVGFDEYIALFNPNAIAANVKVSYYLTDSASVSTTRQQLVTVPAGARSTIAVHDVVGRGYAVSAVVESTNNVGVVAERPIYFRYTLRDGTIADGGHVGSGVSAPATAWYFAEGYTGATFDEYLTILNPGNTMADVRVDYAMHDGNSQVQTLTVAAGSRTTIGVHDVVGLGKEVSAKVTTTNGVAIVVERPIYFAYALEQGGLATDGSLGGVTTAPANDWYFAEGYTGDGFDEYLALFNPDPTTSAVVEVNYLLGDGTRQVTALTVPALRRATVAVFATGATAPGRFGAYSAVLAGVGRGKAVGIHLRVTAGPAIVAERPIYYRYAGPAGAIDGGDVGVGATAPALVWNLAEGYTGAGFDEYLAILNPQAVPVSVRVWYRFADGTSQQQDVTVAAGQRQTIAVHDVVGRGKELAVTVASQSGLGIAVERVMYFVYGASTDGGHIGSGLGN